MKRFLAVACAAVLLSAPLAGCGVLQGVTGAVPMVQLRATQAEFVAESTFAASSAALEHAVDSGAIKGESATRARVAYGKAHEALLSMRRALALGNTVLAAAQAQEAITSSGEVNALAKGS